MEKHSIIQLVSDFWRPEPHYKHGQFIETSFAINGKPLHLSIYVTDTPARLSDLVPLARSLTDKLTSTLIAENAQSGQPIQCRKGCSACCCYLVALSLPEVYDLQQIVASIPAECRVPVVHACIHAARKILDLSVLEKHSICRSTDMNAINQWYAGLRLKCPFLSAGSCSIYEQRPLACREHLVVSPSGWCDSRQNHSPQIVDIPVSLLEALGQLAGELQQTEVEAVILPLAVTGMDHYGPQDERTWPAVEMVQRLLQILETAVSKSPALAGRG